MRIGDTRRVETGVPRPIRREEPRREEPRREPSREPVPVRVPERVAERHPIKTAGLRFDDIVYICPIGGEEMHEVDTHEGIELACPKHGIQEPISVVV